MSQLMSLLPRDYSAAQSDDGIFAGYHRTTLDWPHAVDHVEFDTKRTFSVLGRDTDSHFYTVLVSNGTASLVCTSPSRVDKGVARLVPSHKAYPIGNAEALLQRVQESAGLDCTFYAFDLWSGSTPGNLGLHPVPTVFPQLSTSTLDDEPDVSWLDSALELDKSGQRKAAIKLITKTIERFKGSSAYQQLAKELTRVNVREFSDMALMAILRGVFSMRSKIYSWDLLRSTIKSEIAKRGVNDTKDLFVGLD